MLCALIIAGGSGKRFWPLSTEDKPKQLLQLFSEKTMIRETVDRILPLIDPERIYVATNIAQADAVQAELPMIPEDNLIIESMAKDTAAAVGYASLYIRREVKDPTLIVLPSDHAIKDGEKFRQALLMAEKEADRSRSIVALGIKPSRPDIGYGYLKLHGEYQLDRVCTIDSFCEKPTLEVAKEYVEEGKYLWNSGIFVFKISTILEEIRKYMPKHDRVLKNILFYMDQGHKGRVLARKTELLFDDFEKKSIDYGIMEKSKIIKVIPSDFGWSDIGSFTAFEDVYEQDQNGNIVRNSDFDAVDSHGNIILTDNLEIKAVGVENLVVVQHNGKLLICDKYQIDKMKKF